MDRGERRHDKRLNRLAHCLAGSVALCAVPIHSAWAAQLDPSQTEKRLEETGREFIPPPMETSAPQLPSKGHAGAAQEIGSFLLSGVRLTGDMLLPAKDFVPTYEEFVATKVDEKTVLKIAARITAQLQKVGYSLSYAVIPPQQVDAGILTIEIVPGRVGGLSIDGVEDGDRYRSYFQELLASRVATQKQLERPILLVNDLPGISVADIALQERDGAPGVYDLALKLHDKPLDFSLYADNRGTHAAGPFQVGIYAAYNGAFRLNDQASVTYFTVPETPRELQYVQGRYQLPIGTDGLLLKISSVYSHLIAGSDLGRVGTKSDSFSASAGLRYPLTRMRSSSLWASVEADFRDAHEENDFGTTFNDRLVVLRGSLDYSSKDDFGGQNFISVTVSQGLTVAGASRKGDQPLSRADGGGSFTKVGVEAYRRQELFTKELALTLRAAGQKSSRALLSAEEFSLGGARFGRAYQYGELTGDDGLAGSVELGYSPELSLAPFKAPTFYLFYDQGIVWNRNYLTGRQSLASTGGGIRFSIGEASHVGLELAKPLTRDTDYSDSRDVRLFFSFSTTF